MVIKAENLSKQYIVHRRGAGVFGLLRSVVKPERDVVDAVKQISFTVSAGEIIGFIGPNGAGKSTTIKMITGILMPTSGFIETMSMQSFKNRKTISHRIGVVMGHRTQLWWNLPISESFELLQAIYKIPTNLYKENMEYFAELLGLGELYRTPLRQLSLGQRMRAELAASLLHNPELVLLDEPTIGLDVVVKDKIREMIKDVNEKKGTTFLLTTHDMNDVEKLCNRVICIDKGEIFYDGNVDTLREKYDTHSTIIFRSSSPVSIDFGENVQMESEGDEYRLKVNKKLLPLSGVVAELFGQYENISNFRIIEPSIEEIFKTFYENI